jgi:subtilisin family serine protease
MRLRQIRESPFAAAVAGPNDILVVEGAKPAATSFGAMSLGDFSNAGGALVAPGVNVMGPALNPSGGETLANGEGTSLASALVAGAAAWLLNVEPSLTNDELFQVPLQQLSVALPIRKAENVSVPDDGHEREGGVL